MKCLKVFLILLASCLVVSCVDSKEVQKMKTNLLNSPFQRGKEGTWSTSYKYYLTDEVCLDCKEIMKLYKNGKFDETREFYYNGKLMATAQMRGTWDISSGKGNSYYFDQECSNGIETKNLNFSEDWFKKFDTDFRLCMNGEYDDEDEVDNSESGLGIIDCTPSVFIVQDLYDSKIYRYDQCIEYLK